MRFNLALLKAANPHSRLRIAAGRQATSRVKRQLISHRQLSSQNGAETPDNRYDTPKTPGRLSRMRRTTSAVMLITLLAFALRISLLGHQELRGDEGFSWNYIQGAPAAILNAPSVKVIHNRRSPTDCCGLSRLNSDSEFACAFLQSSSAFCLYRSYIRLDASCGAKKLACWPR